MVLGLWQRRVAGVPPASPAAAGVLAAATCEGKLVGCASWGPPAKILHSPQNALPLQQQTAWQTVQIRQFHAKVSLPVQPIPIARLEADRQLLLN